MSTKNQVDSGYSWVVLAVCFLLNLILNAAAGGMGVLLVELMHHFNTQKSVIMWIGGILVSVGLILSIIIGWFIKKFGCRLVGCVSSLASCISLVLASLSTSILHLYITYGFMLGFFISCYFNISSIAVQQYFEKRRALAQGTLMAGLSAGLFIWPPLTRLMMDIYGWRGALLLHGGIQLHGMVLCSLIRPINESKTTKICQVNMKNDLPSPDSKQTENKTNNESFKTENGTESLLGDKIKKQEILQHNENAEEIAAKLENKIDEKKNVKSKRTACCNAFCKVLYLYPHYILHILAIFCVQTGNVLPYTLTPARADALGIDKHLGALIVSSSAGISGVFRILSGLLGDRKGVNKLVLCGISGILAGALTAFSVILTTFNGLVIVFAIVAIPSATFMASFGSAAVDIVGKEYIQQAIALVSVGFGFAQLCTFAVTGWLSDLLGDPKYGFLVFGILETFGGFLFLATYILNKRKSKPVSESTKEEIDIE